MNDTVFDRMLCQFTSAVESGDGKKLAELFTKDGVYNDCFYGAFHGRDAIARMLEMHFWGHAEGFRWQMFEPIANTAMGYARYRFSYVSKLDGAEGERVVFVRLVDYEKQVLQMQVLKTQLVINSTL